MSVRWALAARKGTIRGWEPVRCKAKAPMLPCTPHSALRRETAVLQCVATSATSLWLPLSCSQVSELMTVAVVALPPIVKVRDLVDTLRSCTHQARRALHVSLYPDPYTLQSWNLTSADPVTAALQAFAVTPDVRTAVETAEPFALHGVTTRLLLLALLKHRVGLCRTPPPGAEPPPARAQLPTSQAERLKTLELLQQIPIKVQAAAAGRLLSTKGSMLFHVLQRLTVQL